MCYKQVEIVKNISIIAPVQANPYFVVAETCDFVFWVRTFGENLQEDRTFPELFKCSQSWLTGTAGELPQPFFLEFDPSHRKHLIGQKTFCTLVVLCFPNRKVTK